MTDVPLLNAFLFTLAGIAVYVLALAVLIKLPPFDVWKHIAQDRNTAAAIALGAVALGLAWIVAAAMH